MNFIFILVSLASCPSNLMGMMLRWVHVDAILTVLESHLRNSERNNSQSYNEAFGNCAQSLFQRMHFYLKSWR